MATGTIFAMLQNGAVVAIKPSAIATPHTRLLAIDGVLLVFHPARLMRCHATIPLTMVDTMLLVGMALINGLCLCSARHDPKPNNDGNDAAKRVHVDLLLETELGAAA